MMRFNGMTRFGGVRGLLYSLITTAAVTGGCTCKKPGGNPVGINGSATTLKQLDFGNVPVNQHARLQLPLKNTGAGGLTINPQTVSPTPGPFTEPVPFKSSVDPGGSATPATVQFAPTVAGPVTGTLTIPTDGTSATVLVALKGYGVDIQVTCAPASVNFGPVQINPSPAPTQTIVCTNNSPSAMAWMSVDPTSIDPTVTITDPAGLVSASHVQPLTPSGTYTLTVAYAPLTVGNLSTQLPWFAAADSAFQTKVSEVPIPINGQGVDGQIVISPNPIAFTGVPSGQSQAATVTVKNIGANAAAISCLRTDQSSHTTQNTSCGTGTPIFALGATTPAAVTSLAAGASFTLPITYTASSAGTDADVFDVDYLPSGSGTTKTVSAPLKGNQTLNPCTLKISPAAISFGTVTAGNALTRSTTLSNTGDQTCNVSGVALDPSTDSSYSLGAGQATSFQVPAGGSATISVTFNLNNSNTPNQRKGFVDFMSDDPSHASGQIPLIAYLNKSNPYVNGWPKWHYDNNNSGKTTADTSGNSGHMAWKFTQLTNASNSGQAYIPSPVVADLAGGGYVIYQVSLDGTLFAIDQNGNQLWKTFLANDTGDSHPATPAVTASGNLFAVSGCDSPGGAGNNLFYVSPAGTILSQQAFGEDGFDACPGLGPDGTLFEADDDGNSGASSDPNSLLAFSASASGIVTQTAGLSLPFQETERFGVAIAGDETSYWANSGLFYGVSPPASGFKVLSAWPTAGYKDSTATSNGAISDLALDPLNTNFAYAYSAWETTGLDKNFNLTTSIQGDLTALSMANGSVQWTQPLPAVQINTSFIGGSPSDYGNAAPAVDNVTGQVYVGNGDGLYAFDETTGVKKWQFKSADVTDSPAIGGDGTVFFGCADGTFYAVNADGSLRWTVSTGGNRISGSPAIADDGTVFFVSDDGVLWAIR